MVLGFFCRDEKLKIFVLKSVHLAVRCSVSSSLNKQVTYCVPQLTCLKLVDLLHVTACYCVYFCCSPCSLSPCYCRIWVLLSQFPGVLQENSNMYMMQTIANLLIKVNMTFCGYGISLLIICLVVTPSNLLGIYSLGEQSEKQRRP